MAASSPTVAAGAPGPGWPSAGPGRAVACLPVVPLPGDTGGVTAGVPGWPARAPWLRC